MGFFGAILLSALIITGLGFTFCLLVCAMCAAIQGTRSDKWNR